MKSTNRINPFAASIAAVLVIAATGIAGVEKTKLVSEPEEPVVQIAILLDTSGSMKGLINQAKSQLWKVVNEFISAEQAGKTPVVQVALYEYGNNGQPEKDLWIRRIQPLTRDLDKVSEELFALTTNGGEEYCGAVIERAIQDLEWDQSSDTFKTIFIAGNEPFTQGPIDAAKACKAAIAHGVIVNTIHCGSESDGIAGKWKMGALLADGSFMIIDQNKTVPHIAAPQDKVIAEWNVKLNGTYIVFGDKGGEWKRNQVAQDANASKLQSGALAQRAVTKASANYWNAKWDLCDALKQKDFKIEDVKAEHLPENMRKMTIEERKAYVAKMTKERADIQKKILELSNERKTFVAAALKEIAGAEGKDTLDSAMIKAIRAQASTKKITFK